MCSDIHISIRISGHALSELALLDSTKREDALKRKRKKEGYPCPKYLILAVQQPGGILMVPSNTSDDAIVWNKGKKKKCKMM